MTIVNRVAALAATALGLIGLYLVLRFAGGAARILGALSQFSTSVFRTLQAR